MKKDGTVKLIEEQKRDNLATFGVEEPSTIKVNEKDLKEVDGLEWNKKNEPLDTPTFFSTQRD